MKKDSGFTIVELMIVIAMIMVVLAIAFPDVVSWQRDARLKSAANELYSNLQWAKLGAAKTNKEWSVVFDPGAGAYYICSDSGADGDWSTVFGAGQKNTVERTVTLSDYNSGVGYGIGGATIPLGGALPGDGVGYTNNIVTFNSRGLCNSEYVYLDHEKNSLAYAVGTRVSGVILLRRWSGSAWN